MVFFKIWPENIKKAFITLQELTFKLNCLNQTCISLKSIMQLTTTFFSDSAIFIEKKDCRKSAVGKKRIFVGKKCIITPPVQAPTVGSRSGFAESSVPDLLRPLAPALPGPAGSVPAGSGSIPLGAGSVSLGACSRHGYARCRLGAGSFTASAGSAGSVPARFPIGACSVPVYSLFTQINHN